MTLDERAGLDVEAVQRRTVRALVGVQATGALGITIGIATASLLARDLSGSEELAGLAQTSQVLGAAAASWLLARLMAVRGRRFGLVTGYVAAATGALVAVLAGVVGSMALLLVGMVLLGASTAANSSARYAATDLAAERHRARALSTVVWATTIGAVVGPNLTGPAGAVARALGIPVLTGPFALGGVGLLVAAAVAFLLLRPDPLLTARALAGAAAAEPQGTSWGRVGHALRHDPVLVAAVAGLACSHATMVAVMVMTPLHMEHGGAELDVIGFVISVHVLGMFAFSPLVGIAADKLGRGPVLAAGGVVLLVSLVLAGASPTGSSWQIFGGLFLLGLGWSLATVAASTLITDHAPLAARTDIQGAADMAMGLTAAAASAGAGVVVGNLGYPVLAALAALLATVVLAAGVVGARHAHPA
jgi:MFS family permease